MSAELSALLSICAGIIIITFSLILAVFLIKYLLLTKPKQATSGSDEERELNLEEVAEKLGRLLDNLKNAEQDLESTKMYLVQKGELTRKKKT